MGVRNSGVDDLKTCVVRTKTMKNTVVGKREKFAEALKESKYCRKTNALFIERHNGTDHNCVWQQIAKAVRAACGGMGVAEPSLFIVRHKKQTLLPQLYDWPLHCLSLSVIIRHSSMKLSVSFRESHFE